MQQGTADLSAWDPGGDSEGASGGSSDIAEGDLEGRPGGGSEAGLAGLSNDIAGGDLEPGTGGGSTGGLGGVSSKTTAGESERGRRGRSDEAARVGLAGGSGMSEEAMAPLCMYRNRGCHRQTDLDHCLVNSWCVCWVACVEQ